MILLSREKKKEFMDIEDLHLNQVWTNQNDITGIFSVRNVMPGDEQAVQNLHGLQLEIGHLKPHRFSIIYDDLL